MGIAEHPGAREERAWRHADRARRWSRYALGLPAAAGWLWALGLAFLPASVDHRTGSMHCGSPVFFDAAARHYRDDDCVPLVDRRIHQAFGVALVTLPVFGAWRAVGHRARRIAAEGVEGAGRRR
ncbi:hypothetical protein [Streptomyces sp. BE303]|uniref:hypothetical protein n=1 Tax=Streptomyces sp. BE303 TaxID=3002528 RepID=UPI002E7637CC|nr:hypothetical protein [Streptomyces sp. BE303]MED7947596.1 hypothetical protein [Streptomyces sp. BE303]